MARNLGSRKKERKRQVEEDPPFSSFWRQDLARDRKEEKKRIEEARASNNNNNNNNSNSKDKNNKGKGEKGTVSNTCRCLQQAREEAISRKLVRAANV